MPEIARGRRGSKIEGGGTRAPLRHCLHMGLRGTAAQEGSAVTGHKLRWMKGFFGAVFAPLRSDASGVSDEARSRRSVPAASGATPGSGKGDQ